LRSKLADFGIAKLHDEQLAFGMQTGTQKIVGSPGYMAPEQCTGRGGIDSRADVYAFGCVLYEMVTGKRPYAGESVFELITSVVSNTPFPRPAQLRPDVPAEWDAVIMECLAHRREDRIQSIQEVVRRLARAVPNGESLMSYSPHPPPTGSSSTASMGMSPRTASGRRSSVSPARSPRGTTS
jgi:serine/threonine protein kinase